MISRIVSIVLCLCALATSAGAQSLVPNPDGQNGKVLGNDGSHAKWIQASDAGLVTVPAVTQVDSGGTGKTTLTTNGVVYGKGTSAVGVTAAGTTGQVLTATTGSAPTWQAAAGGISKQILTMTCNGALSPAEVSVLVNGTAMTGDDPTAALGTVTLVSIPGTFKNLCVAMSSNSTSGGDTVWLQKNGVSSVLFARVANGGSTGCDNTHTVTVVAGDLVSYFWRGSEAAARYVASVEFDPS